MASYSSFKKIETESIIDGAVTGQKLGTDSVTTAKFAAASVRTSDIINGAVGTNQLAATVDLSGKTVTYRPIITGDFTNGTITGGKLATGAVTTNLGFTPLNRAGDTASGQFSIIDGSATTTSLQGSSDANTGIYFTGTDALAISTGGTARLLMDASGRTQEPNRPSFYACGDGGWYYSNSFGGPNSWRDLSGAWTWSVSEQGGSNFNTSTGRFTAPVSGYYYFYSQAYHYNDNNEPPNYIHWNIGRNSGNSTGPSSRSPHTMYSHGVPSNHTPGIQCSIQFYMTAGDYACNRSYWAAAAGRIHGNHHLWCGFLIG
jgi:hypothetical protein